MRRLYKYGLAVVRDSQLLLCKPYAFDDLIMPGGIVEGDESPVDGIAREVAEELGSHARLDRASLTFLGHFSDLAAGRVDTLIEMDVWLGDVTGELRASSEIKELVWYASTDDPSSLSAVVRTGVVPALIERGLM